MPLAGSFPSVAWRTPPGAGLSGFGKVRGGAGPRAQRPTPLPAAPSSSPLSPRRSVGHGLPFASPICAEASGVAAYPALTFPTCAACLAGVRRPI